MKFMHSLAHRISVVSTAALVALILLAGTVGSAHAGIPCRVDPIAILSDGTHVMMRTSAATDAENVQLVQYTVHGPVGTSLDKVVYAGPFFVDDDVTFVADNAAGVYSVDVTVTASVTAEIETTIQVRDSRTTTTGWTNTPVSSSVTP
jgi:hypothetical protein